MEDPDDTDISEEEDEFEQPRKCISSAESHPSAALVCLQDISGMQAAQFDNLANNLAQGAQRATETNVAMAAFDGAPKGGFRICTTGFVPLNGLERGVI